MEAGGLETAPGNFQISLRGGHSPPWIRFLKKEIGLSLINQRWFRFLNLNLILKLIKIYRQLHTQDGLSRPAGTRPLREAQCPPASSLPQMTDGRLYLWAEGIHLRIKDHLWIFPSGLGLPPFGIRTSGGIIENIESSVKKWNKPPTIPLFRGNHPASAPVEWA